MNSNRINNNNNLKLNLLEEENKRLKSEIKIWINISKTLEEIKSNLLSKISLMKFECNKNSLDNLVNKYQSIQSNIIKLNDDYCKYKFQLNKFNNNNNNKISQPDINHKTSGQQINSNIDREEVIIDKNNDTLAVESGCDLSNNSDNIDEDIKKKKALICDYMSCKKRFYKLSILQAHKSMHFNGYSYQCEWPGCQKTFNKKHHYIKHRYLSI